MVTHLAVYRTDLVREIGGCRLGFEGSQDYDLMLRIIDRSSDAQIIHVPRVLYHWRIHAQSTAGGHTAKPYALHAAKRAIEEHLQRNGVRAGVQPQLAYGTCRVEFAVPTPPPLATIIIPTRNAHELVKTCVESIRAKTDYPNYEILLIDNGSDVPEALAYFQKLKNSGVRVLRDDRPFNYSALNNGAVADARGEVVVLMNNDIEVISPDWLSEMVSHACRHSVGAVGAKLLYPSDRVQHAGVVIGIGGCAGHVHKGLPAAHWGYFSRACVTQNFSAVTGACLAVRREHYLAVGGLNETDLKVAFNDIDFCLRLSERGLKTVFTPRALLYHHESATRGYEDNPEKIARFEREVAFFRDRWRALLYADPFYSPNLTLAHENMGLAYPPRVSRWPVAAQAFAGASVGIIIPTLNAGPKWDLVLDSIARQAAIRPQVLVIDSGSTDDTVRRARSAGCRVIEISANTFGHGKTRQQAIDALDCEFVVLMTQDALLASPDSVTTLLSAFSDPKVALAYGRQLAASDASLSARVLREFNYPCLSEVRSFADRKRLGLKCAFNSNSFAAYRVSMLREVGGFDCEAPVGEDILACAALLKAGYQSAYVSTAYVVHSHNYSFAQEYARYLQIGQMHAMRPDLLKTFGKPEGEGLRLIRAELKEALRIAPWVGIATLIRAAVKYLGYRRGRMLRA
jgi:GT2 family glycosyltransferase